MQNVSRFEASLLRLLYFFLRREPFERALPLIEGRIEAPAGLSTPAMQLVKDALAKGCTFLLASRGGWRDERHLRNAVPVGGRLWNRTEPKDLGLTFSPHSMQFLMWITSVRPSDKTPVWQPEHDELTHGDLMLLFFAHEGLRETSETLGVPLLRRRQPYGNHALCWLAYPEDYATTPAECKPNFTPWVSGVGSCILEALQPELYERWIHIESSKERIERPDVMRGLGGSQDRVLTAFLDAIEKANRRDLARFVLRSLCHLLGGGAHPGMWTGALQMTGQRLADRAATYQAAVALLRCLDRLNSWTRWARSCGFFDENYHSAQLWLADWEQFQGDDLVPRAQTIIRNLDPMRAAAAAAGGGGGASGATAGAAGTT